MIPTMILLGFIFGRWWKVAVPLGALAWPLMLVTSGIDPTVVAAALGVINAGVGAAMFLALATLARVVSRRWHTHRTSP